MFYRVCLGKDIPEDVVAFSETLFFDLLFPFVIFNAGFGFKRVLFFANSGLILLLAIAGTLVSFAIIAAGISLLVDYRDWDSFYSDGVSLSDILALGAIFAATDTVAVLQILNQDEYPMLYSLAFGEGLVNDAVAVVLAKAVDGTTSDELSASVVFELIGVVIYLFVLSVLVGILFGLATAFFLRRCFYLARKHHAPSEVGVLMLMSFMAYYMSEASQLSAITTIFVCGIVGGHYSWHNLDDTGKILSMEFATMASDLCEITMFILAGLDTFNIDLWKEAYGRHVCELFFMALFLIFLARAVVIFPCCYLANTSRPDAFKVSLAYQGGLWWGGLIRGTVTVALAYKAFGGSIGDDTDSEDGKYEPHSTFLATTLLIVQFTSIVFGTISEPVFNWLCQDDETSSNIYRFIPMILRARGVARDTFLDEEMAENQRRTSAMVNPHHQVHGTLDSTGQKSTSTMELGEVTEGTGLLGSKHPNNSLSLSRRRTEDIKEEEFTPAHPWWLSEHLDIVNLAVHFRNFDRNTMQPIFGGRYAPAPPADFGADQFSTVSEANLRN